MYRNARQDLWYVLKPKEPFPQKSLFQGRTDEKDQVVSQVPIDTIQTLIARCFFFIALLVGNSLTDAVWHLLRRQVLWGWKRMFSWVIIFTASAFCHSPLKGTVSYSCNRCMDDQIFVWGWFLQGEPVELHLHNIHLERVALLPFHKYCFLVVSRRSVAPLGRYSIGFHAMAVVGVAYSHSAHCAYLRQPPI